MSKIKLITLVLFFINLPLTANALVGVCDDPLRDQNICKRMRHLRGQVNLLEAQRDLMQVNYPFLESLARDMDGLTSELIENHNETGILNGLVAVKSKVKPIIEYAKAKDSRALVAANQVHMQCATCHSVEKPLSGYNWDTIAKMTWGGINLKCNEEVATIRIREDGGLETIIEASPRKPHKVRNPYRCKSMHGMFANFEYFLTADNTGRIDYRMTEASAKEVLRIATDLENKNMVHRGANHLFNEVKRRASEIAKLASEKDPQLETKRLELVLACTQCHNSDSGIPFSADVSMKKSIFSQFK